MKKFLVKSFFVVLLPFVKLYWFIFRPKTFGVKIIIECKEKILAIKQTYGTRWTFPGGGIEKGETEKEAIIREAHEELGITIANPLRLGSFISTAEYKRDNVTVFLISAHNERVILDGVEVDMYGWFYAKELPPLGEVAQTIFNFYLRYKKYGTE